MEGDLLYIVDRKKVKCCSSSTTTITFRRGGAVG